MGVDLIGIAAGVLTTASFFPQLVKTYRTRRAEDFNVLFLLMFLTGVALWFAYGILLGNVPIILANGIALLSNGALLAMKIVFARGGAGRGTGGDRP